MWKRECEIQAIFCDRVAQELASVELKNVAVLKGGWDEWVMSQYPVEKK
jgi:3-mercaptopyruvate sulfurtransferase SseA